MNTARLCCTLAAGLVFCGIARAADTLEDVEKNILLQAEKSKTLSARMVMTSDLEGPSMRMKSKAEGTYEYARRGDTVMFRMESKSTGTTKIADQPETTSDDKSLVVADGRFCYTLTETAGQKMAVKMKLDPAKSNVAGRDGFDQLHKNYNLKLLPDEKLDSRDVYVIEATPKKPKPDTTEKHKYYYTKDSGILVRSVTESKGEQGRSTVTFALNDIKPDADIKPERFVFKAPEGVEVMDMTQIATTGSDEAASQGKTDAGDKEEKKAEPQPASKDEPKKDPKKPRIPLPKLKNPLK